MLFFFFFFFSSRRRHTRCGRDWSSDVCSSDLGLTHLTPWLMRQVGEAADGAGHIWRVHDVRETAVIAMLLTMGFTSLLALLRVFQPEHLGADYRQAASAGQAQLRSEPHPVRGEI